MASPDGCIRVCAVLPNGAVTCRCSRSYSMRSRPPEEANARQRLAQLYACVCCRAPKHGKRASGGDGKDEERGGESTPADEKAADDANSSALAARFAPPEDVPAERKAVQMPSKMQPFRMYLHGNPMAPVEPKLLAHTPANDEGGEEAARTMQRHPRGSGFITTVDYDGVLRSQSEHG